MTNKDVNSVTRNLTSGSPSLPDQASEDTDTAADAVPLDPQELDPRQITERVDLRVLSAIRRIIHSVDLYSRELAAKTHITAPQLVCLITLAERGAMTATTISREVFLSPSTVVGILDRLEEKGLVKRERMSKDRRVVTVTITQEGRKLAGGAPSPLQNRLTEALSVLPLPEQIAIAKSLERVVNLMEAQHIDASPILETGPIVKPNKDDVK
ncbi:MAG: MarR family transcriptional regulator [Burkholderiales bacterium]|jgi:DNA-binding MarR family transcriptional regulator